MTELELSNAGGTSSARGSSEPVVLISTSEITLKSRYVRGSLQRTLLEHLRWKLRRSGFTDFTTEIDIGRLVISGLDDEHAAEVCSKVFGVAFAAYALRLSSEPAGLTEEIVRYAKTHLSKGESFAVRAHIVGPYPMSGREIEKSAGSAICARLGKGNITVDLENPAKTIHIEIRGETLYLYDRRVEGAGGLPYGTQGRLVGMLSEDIDGIVALWLMMKRGSHVIPLFLSKSHDSDRNREADAIEMAQNLREFAPVDKYLMMIAPFQEIIEATSSVKGTEYRWVLCKRMMYRIACSIAEKVHGLGIVTGERLEPGSRILMNLSTINEAAWLPAYRPLIGLDDVEIQTIAQRMGFVEVLTAKREEPASTHQVLSGHIEPGRLREIEGDLQADLLVKNAVDGIRKMTI